MKKSQKQAIGVGAALAAATAAAAAGAYFFAGKEGAKHRKAAAKWTDKVQKDLMKQVKSMENVTKTNYHKAVDMVSKQYSELKDIDKKDLTNLAKELKGNWDKISQELDKASKLVSKTKIIPTAKKSVAKKVSVNKAAPKKPATKKAPTKK